MKTRILHDELADLLRVLDAVSAVAMERFPERSVSAGDLQSALSDAENAFRAGSHAEVVSIARWEAVRAVCDEMHKLSAEILQADGGFNTVELLEATLRIANRKTKALDPRH